LRTGDILTGLRVYEDFDGAEDDVFPSVEALFNAEAFEQLLASGTVVKMWNGSSWLAGIPKVWTGSSWTIGAATVY
jgi:hypothetical protein